MKKVYVLTTGGTIASKYNTSAGLYTAGAMQAKELVNIENSSFDFEVIVEDFLQIQSSAMTFEALFALKQRIDQIFTEDVEDNIVGIVVTHGTDTLEESAFFLDLCLNCKRPVVLTGSQRSPQGLGSDAYKNLQDALLVAASEESCGLGVVVLFNENIYNARYVHKSHTSALQTFTSHHYGILGYVDADCVRIVQRPSKKKHYVIDSHFASLESCLTAHKEGVKLFPQIEIVKASLGMSDFFFDSVLSYLDNFAINSKDFAIDSDDVIRDTHYSVKKSDASIKSSSTLTQEKVKISGIIIEGLGRGHVPAFVSASARNVCHRIPVLMTSDCEMGQVHKVYDFQGSLQDLEANGGISAFDYSAKKARVLLTILLALAYSKDEIKQEFCS